MALRYGRRDGYSVSWLDVSNLQMAMAILRLVPRPVTPGSIRDIPAFFSILTRFVWLSYLVACRQAGLVLL